MGASPTILFQGSQNYGPNIDAVDCLINTTWLPACGNSYYGATVRWGRGHQG